MAGIDPNFRLVISTDSKTLYASLIAESKKSKASVVINGKGYLISGDMEAISWINERISKANNFSDFGEFKTTLLKDSEGTKKTQNIALETLEISTEKAKVDLSSLKEEIKSTVPKGAGGMVAVLERERAPFYIFHGTTNAEGGNELNENTAALIGSGAKMFTALLCKVLEEKGVLNLKSKLSDFMKEEHFHIFADPEKAKKITLESLLSHTSGLQYYADDDHNEREGLSLGKIFDSYVKEALADSTRKFRFIIGHPEDKIYSYSNLIGLAAAAIEDTYKKHIAIQLISQHRLSRDTKISDLENAPITLSQSSITLGQLIDAKSAYIDGQYVYDVLDLFLESAGLNPIQYDYARILKEELLNPIGMTRTTFEKPKENVLQAYQPGQTPHSVNIDIKDPMMRGAGGLWSTPGDMMRLAASFQQDGSLVGKEGVLISEKGLADITNIRGINGKTGLGVDVEGTIFGKGGSYASYDFKFRFDRSTGNSVLTMCNFDNCPEQFVSFLSLSLGSLEVMNPELKQKSSVGNGRALNFEELQRDQKADVENCNQVFFGKQGYVGVSETEEGININWNGLILPAKKMDGELNKFIIFAEGPHAGTEVLFREGEQSKTHYLFIERGNDSTAFTEVKKEKLDFPKNRGFLDAIKGSEGTYKSPIPGGPKPIIISIDKNQGIQITYGNRQPVPALITKVIQEEGTTHQVWLAHTAEEVPDKLYKLIKNGEEWSLAIVFIENPTMDPLETISRDK